MTKLTLLFVLIFASLLPAQIKAFSPGKDLVAKETPPAKIIKGQVTDIKGQPLVNVTIQIKGSSKTTTSDDQGYYSISVEENDVLIFSFVGYKTREEAVKSRTVLNIELEQTDKQMG